MKLDESRAVVWVTVKVERGYVSEAKVFGSEKPALEAQRKWLRRLNPDYDEVGVVKSRLCFDKKTGMSRTR